jgi:hypothetical protein
VRGAASTRDKAPAEGCAVYDHVEIPTEGCEMYDQVETPLEGCAVYDQIETPVEGCTMYDQVEIPTEGCAMYDQVETPVEGCAIYDQVETPVEGCAMYNQVENHFHHERMHLPGCFKGGICVVIPMPNALLVRFIQCTCCKVKWGHHDFQVQMSSHSPETDS